ncbi:TORC1 subunit TCO89 [Candida albicans]|nr:hypothetical protein MGI_00464 [Candida albicans P75016]
MSAQSTPKKEYSNDSRPQSTENDTARSKRGGKDSQPPPFHNSTVTRSSLPNNPRPASTGNIPRNTSTPSLNKKQANRLKTHNRSLSHNKSLTKLSTSTGATARPHLNRSKSTEVLLKSRQGGALKRNSRSLTKMTALQPMTKTTSSPTLPTHKSTTSLKNINSTCSIGLKSSARKGKAILQLNDDDADYEDVENLSNDEDTGENNAPVPERFDSQDTISTTHSQDEQNIPSLYEQINRILPEPTPASEEPPKFKDKLEVVEEGNTIDSKVNTSHPELGSSTKSSTDDFSQANNFYSGSLLLSQSTGLVRKIDPKHSANLKMTEAYPAMPSDEALNSTAISGISFKANPMELNNAAEPVTTSKNVSQNNSYQPDQTIFNNLQRTNNQYLMNKKQQHHQQQQQQQQKTQQKPQQKQQQVKPLSPAGTAINNGTNNFSDFLRTNNSTSSADSQYGHNIETRTQQRLWLQRESSLMDVTNLDANRMSNFSNLSLNNLMFSHNYNNQSQANIRDLQYSGSVPQQHQPLTPMTPATPGVGNNGSYPGSDVNGNQGLLNLVQGTLPHTVQTKIEFERLNREYLNVRRHANPMGESLKRLESYSGKELKVSKTRKGDKSTTDANASTFEEFSPTFHEKETEISNTLSKLWQDAIVSSSSSSAARPTQPATQHHPTNQRSINPRLASYNQNYNNSRQNQAPNTRAVKLAPIQTTDAA